MFYIVFQLQKNAPISATRCPIEMEFGSKCKILNGQVIYIENIADMWVIPLDCVTYVCVISGIMAFYWFGSTAPCNSSTYTFKAAQQTLFLYCLYFAVFFTNWIKFNFKKNQFLK